MQKCNIFGLMWAPWENYHPMLHVFSPVELMLSSIDM